MTSQILDNEERICHWLVEAVARHCEVAASAVNASTAFVDVGLSSMAAVMLSLEVSEALGVDVDPMLTWDHPTIGEAARAIAKSLPGG
jgi:acyl carrier protein